PAQPRLLVGDLGPQAELLGHPQAGAVLRGGLVVVARELGERAERERRLHLAPALAHLAEQRRRALGLLARARVVALADAVDEGGRDAPPVTQRLERGERAGGEGDAAGVADGGERVAEEPLRAGARDRVDDP